MSELTRFEEQILLSVCKLQNEAYGISIYQNIRDITQKDLAIGGIYFPLERLVKKGFLEAHKGEPTPVRGGQSKRYYKLTELGKEELIKAKKTQEAFWKGLRPLKISAGEHK
jgi:PadR family transcriptional regulator PadR